MSDYFLELDGEPLTTVNDMGTGSQLVEHKSKAGIQTNKEQKKKVEVQI